MLIGAGIGITPFASILQSIMYRLVLGQQLRLWLCWWSSGVALGGTGCDVHRVGHGHEPELVRNKGSRPPSKARGVRGMQAGLCLPMQVPPAKAELPQLPLFMV